MCKQRRFSASLHRVAAACVLVLGLLSPCWATDSYCTNTESSGNITLWARVTIPGVTEAGDQISGTNVNVQCEAGARGQGTNTPYDGAKLYKAELKIDGTEVFSGTGTKTIGAASGATFVGAMLSTGGGGGTVPPAGAELPQTLMPVGARFASNHFGHSAVVAVELKAYFHMTKNNVVLADDSVTTTASVLVYNRLLDFASDGGQSGTTLQDIIVDLPGYPPNAYVSLDEALRVKAKFQAMNYLVDDTAPLNKFTEANVLGALNNCTAMFSSSHGAPVDSSGHATGLYDSLFVPNNNTTITWQEMADELALASRTAPPLSWAHLSSCSAFGSAAASSLGLLNQTDRAFVGVEGDAYLYTVDVDPGVDAITETDMLGVNVVRKTLADVSEAFYASAVEGKTAAECAAAMNASRWTVWTSGQNGGFVRLPLKVGGDDNTRLNYVYLGKTFASMTATEKTAWYVELP